MARTKGSKNKPRESQAEPLKVTEPPKGLTAKQRDRAKVRSWAIANLQKQIADLNIRLDKELDGLAEDMAGTDAPSKARAARKPRVRQLPLPKCETHFAPEQEEGGAELEP